MKKRLTRSEYTTAETQLYTASILDIDFFALLIFASIICFFGFVMDSPTVIIGSMVISPLLTPFVRLSGALVDGDIKTFSKIFSFIVIELLIVFLVSIILAHFFPIDIRSSEIVSRLSAKPLLYFIVAVLCGLAGSFGYFWPKVKETIIGVGISVALIPPAVLFGISIITYPEIFATSGLIFLINLLGIILGASVMIFILKHSMIKD